MVFSVIMAMLKIMKLEREEISVRRNTIAPEERLSSLKFVKSMASRIPSLIEKSPSVTKARSAILAPEISIEGEPSMTSVTSSGRFSRTGRFCPKSSMTPLQGFL